MKRFAKWLGSRIKCWGLGHLRPSGYCFKCEQAERDAKEADALRALGPQWPRCVDCKRTFHEKSRRDRKISKAVR